GYRALRHSLGAARCAELLEGILRQLSLAQQDIDTYHRLSEPARGRDDRSLARLGEILTCEVWRQCHSSDRSSEEQRGSFHRENLTRLTRVGRAGKSGNARWRVYVSLQEPASRSTSDVPPGSPSSHRLQCTLVFRPRSPGRGTGSRQSEAETADRPVSGGRCRFAQQSQVP